MLMLNNEHTRCDLGIIKKAATKYETPFYLYDANILRMQYQSIAKALGGCADVFYSIKANPNISVCKLLKNLGAGAEICSEYEFYAALKAGFDPQNIIFVGPAKSDKEIQLCIAYNIYAIVCESLSEYKKISSIASEMNVKARVALRINPDFYSKSALLKMGGKPSQFGIDEKTILENIDFFKSKSNIQLQGIHVYNGTRILDEDNVYQNTKEILALTRKLSNIFNIDFEMVDIGGGIGVPYHANEKFFDIKKFSELIIPELNKFKTEYPNIRIILESGRYLVALAGAFVSRIVDIKASKGENFIVTDGGTNCHMAAVGVGGIVKRNFPIRAVAVKDDSSKNNKNKYNITGPLCTPGDLIGKDVFLDEVCEGDLIVIDRSGAYGPTASPILFLSHGHPAEILTDDEGIHLIRTPDNVKNYFKNQIIL